MANHRTNQYDILIRLYETTLKRIEEEGLSLDRQHAILVETANCFSLALPKPDASDFNRYVSDDSAQRTTRR